MNDVQWNTCKAICLNVRSFWRPRCQCLCKSSRLSRSQRQEINGFKHVLDEVSIVKILKQLRVLQAVARQDKTQTEWKRLNKLHAEIEYSDLDSDSSTELKTIKIATLKHPIRNISPSNFDDQTINRFRTNPNDNFVPKTVKEGMQDKGLNQIQAKVKAHHFIPLMRQEQNKVSSPFMGPSQQIQIEHMTTSEKNHQKNSSSRNNYQTEQQLHPARAEDE